MLRTRITELGKLNFLSDGGLVCSVTSDQPPLLDASARAAAFSGHRPTRVNWLSETGSHIPNMVSLATGDARASIKVTVKRIACSLSLHTVLYCTCLLIVLARIRKRGFWSSAELDSRPSS
jgi:hypothetical protein